MISYFDATAVRGRKRMQNEKQERESQTDGRRFHLQMRCPLAIVVGSCLILAPGAAHSGDVRQLTQTGRVKFAPVFVRDGQEIAWCEHDQPNRVSIVRLDLQTGKTTTMFPDDSSHRFDPAFSSDGRYLCFGRSGGPRQLSLVIVDLKANTQAVFEPPGGLRATIRTPRFIPRGDRVLFTINGTGGQQIASVDLKAQDYRKVTESSGINGWPDVSRNGKQIVFSSSRGGTLDLYLMKIDGSGVRRLTDHRLRDVRPAFSPDGSRIAFTSARDGNDEIYLITSDGGGLTQLTKHAERDDYPVWHPDGRQIAWIAERNGQFDLYLMPVEE